jgi:hypothetical protein
MSRQQRSVVPCPLDNKSSNVFFGNALVFPRRCFFFSFISPRKKSLNRGECQNVYHHITPNSPLEELYFFAHRSRLARFGFSAGCLIGSAKCVTKENQQFLQNDSYNDKPATKYCFSFPSALSVRATTGNMGAHDFFLV